MGQHPHKIVVDKSVFRTAVAKASKILSEQVAVTLGPDGLPVLLKSYDGQSPKITKDGVTVADSIFLKDPVLDTIVQTIKEAARKTNTEAGDGTTTAIILTNAIIVESMKYINTGTITPQSLSRAIKYVGEFLLSKISSFALPVSNPEQAHNVAMISSNGDKTVADSVVEAVTLAGEHGIITIEDGFGPSMNVIHADGFHMNSGFQKLGPKGPALITNHDKQSIDFTFPAILVYDGDLVDPTHIRDFWAALSNNGTNAIPLVIMAYSFSDIVMMTIAMSKTVGISIIPVVCPIYSSSSVRRLFMEDFATWTGGKVVDCHPKSIMTVVDGVNVDTKYLGSCDKITMSRDLTICYGGKGLEDEILTRVNALNTLREEAKSQYEKDIFHHRLAMMTGGVVAINVGGQTEIAMKERKDRVIDALAAVKASIKMGVVPGGGSILLKLLGCLEEDVDEQISIAQKIFTRAFSYPIRQLASNAGMSPDVIECELASHLKIHPKGGWNLNSNILVNDMVECGIVDPALVTYSAISNAISIATELLCGGGAVVFQEKEISEKSDVDGFYMNEEGNG